MGVTGIVLLCAWMAAEEGGSLLSREPLPLLSEPDAYFQTRDIHDATGMVARLLEFADRPQTPEGRLWERLPAPLRHTLATLPVEMEISKRVRIELVRGLNAALRRPDLYSNDIWSDTSLPDALVERLRAASVDAREAEVAAANRALVEITFSDYVSVQKRPRLPIRPKTLRLFGDDFLKPGRLRRGIHLPTGAVWQPSLLVFGTYRTAWQYENTGDRFPSTTDADDNTIPGPRNKREEWVNRLDVVFNLYLTPTERIVLGMRPIDQNEEFTGYVWQPDRPNDNEGWEGTLDSRIEILFFEGDFGELFPRLDLKESRRLDIGFSIGRQPLFIQEGILLDDIVDGVGLTRNNILIPGTSNTRITAFWGWGNVNRGVGPGVNRRDDSANLYGLFTSIDFPRTTVDLDIIYVDAQEESFYPDEDTRIIRRGDQWNFGVSAVQRIGRLNTTLRIGRSSKSGGANRTDDASDGTLVLVELSIAPPRTHDLLYLTSFWVEDDYRSAARGPDKGGPLDRVGILFESPEIGALGSSMTDTAVDSVGGALGYQKFFDDTRKHVILEVAGRTDTDGTGRGEAGIGLRYQQAIKNRFVWRMDAFYVDRQGLVPRKGFRSEFQVQF